MGGGGVGEYGDFSGGSGSNFVEWRRENLTRSMELEVSVGETGRRSTVSSNGTILVEAAAGGGPSDYTGGSGYSVGGGGGKDRAGKGVHFVIVLCTYQQRYSFCLSFRICRQIYHCCCFSSFASKRTYLAFFFICQHRW